MTSCIINGFGSKNIVLKGFGGLVVPQSSPGGIVTKGFGTKSISLWGYGGGIATNIVPVIISKSASINRGFSDMIIIKTNESLAARRRIPFDLVSSSDYVTAMTGQIVPLSAIKVYPNGGTETTALGNVGEIGGGLYYYECATAEVGSLGQITVRVNYSGAMAFKAAAQVVAFDPYDATRYGLSSLPDATCGASGGIITFGSGVAQLNLDGIGGGYISLSQNVPVVDLSGKTTQNIGDCLSAARAECAGPWHFAGTVETIYGPDGVQVVRTFTLNDAQNPTQRG